MWKSQHIYMMLPHDSKEYRSALLLRIEGFRRFAEWEKEHPVKMDPLQVLSAVGALYDLLPSESRRRRVDPNGIIAMKKALALLK